MSARVLFLLFAVAFAAEPCKDAECATADDEITMLQIDPEDGRTQLSMRQTLEPKEKECMTWQTPEDTSKKASAAAAAAATAELTKLTAIADDMYTKASAEAQAMFSHVNSKNVADKTAKLAASAAHYTEAVDRADAEAKKQLMHDQSQVDAKKKRAEALAIQNTKWSMDEITREHARSFQTAATIADQTEKEAQQAARSSHATKVTTELTQVMGKYTTATKKHQASMKAIQSTWKLEKIMAADKINAAKAIAIAAAETERAKLAASADREKKSLDASALLQRDNQLKNVLAHKNAMKEEAKNEMNTASMAAWVETMSNAMSDVTLCDAPIVEKSNTQKVSIASSAK